MARVTIVLACALVAFAGLPGTALGSAATELVVEHPGPIVEVGQGKTAEVTLEVRAEGDINCGAHTGNPAIARLETTYSLVGGDVVAGGAPGDWLPFYRAHTAQPPPAGGCPVTWSGAPAPYTVNVIVAVAPNTPPGNYEVTVETDIAGKSDAMTDDTPSSFTVRALPGAKPPPPPPFVAPTAAPPPKSGLPPPQENKTVNLLPVKGKVYATYPRAKRKVRIGEATQVPTGTKVNAKGGYVQVVSDRTGDGTGDVQSATFWNDAFAVGYTRTVVPGTPRRRRRAKRPITELKLTSRCASRARLSTRGVFRLRDVEQSARRRRRRGLFGRGRGRYRTRGSFGAGTVRGTSWYTENRCDGTLFLVTSGVVTVRDFGLGRSVTVRRGQGYLAGPHKPNEGTSEG